MVCAWNHDPTNNKPTRRIDNKSKKKQRVAHPFVSHCFLVLFAFCIVRSTPIISRLHNTSDMYILPTSRSVSVRSLLFAFVHPFVHSLGCLCGWILRHRDASRGAACFCFCFCAFPSYSFLCGLSPLPPAPAATPAAETPQRPSSTPVDSGTRGLRTTDTTKHGAMAGRTMMMMMMVPWWKMITNKQSHAKTLLPFPPSLLLKSQQSSNHTRLSSSLIA